MCQHFLIYVTNLSFFRFSSRQGTQVLDNTLSLSLGSNGSNVFVSMGLYPALGFAK